MGIKSTYDIDRSTAIEVITSKVYGCTNEQLASMLLDFNESYFRNYCVWNQLPKEDKYGMIIESVEDF